MWTPKHGVDLFSDYDVLCVVNDIRPFHADPRWLGELGAALVVFRNPIGREHGFESFGFITHYQDGTKVDFRFFPWASLQWTGARVACQRFWHGRLQQQTGVW